jgi:16S rRNA (guanine966-N2)-methyltransferase
MAELRIIGGTWRSRRIAFFDYPGIRPSLNQIRETVFNWLQTKVESSVCLDLFAGSGAFGLEALSRGAKSVDFIDNHPKVISYIQASLKQLQAEEKSKTYLRQLPNDLRQLQKQYDIIFVDPPYGTPLLQQSLYYLRESELLAAGAIVYFEAGKRDIVNTDGWDILRHKFTKNLQYGIISRIH